MDKTMTKLAFLGLGVMGSPMAGHSVTVYNRTKAKAGAVGRKVRWQRSSNARSSCRWGRDGDGPRWQL